MAASLATAHEVKGANGTYDLPSQMDLYNNGVGRGAHVPMQSGYSIVGFYGDIIYSLLINGHLVYLKNGTTLTPTNQ